MANIEQVNITQDQPQVHRVEKNYVNAPPAPVFGLDELKTWSLYRAVIAEFVATLLFLYVTIATIVSQAKLIREDPCDGVGLLGYCCGMIFVLVYCTAGISVFLYIIFFYNQVQLIS